jgi:hypothetical protein
MLTVQDDQSYLAIVQLALVSIQSRTVAFAGAPQR